MAQRARPVDEEDARPEHDRIMAWLWENYRSYLHLIFEFSEEIEQDRIDAARLRLGARLSETDLFADAIWELDYFVAQEEVKAVEGGTDTSRPYSQRHRLLALFDVAPKVSSLSEVLGKLNRYRHAVIEEIGTKAFVLVTGDDRFDDILTDQGIFVIHPGEDTVHSPAEGLEERSLDLPPVDERGG